MDWEACVFYNLKMKLLGISFWVFAKVMWTSKTGHFLKLPSGQNIICHDSEIALTGYLKRKKKIEGM